MISLRQINALPAPERDRCYLSIVPPSFCERFGLEPLAFTDSQGRPLASLEAPPGAASVRLSIRHRADALDPAFFLRLDESRYGHLQITWIILNDPEGSHFGVDLDDEGKLRELGARTRNLRAEESWRPAWTGPPRFARLARGAASGAEAVPSTMASCRTAGGRL